MTDRDLTALLRAADPMPADRLDRLPVDAAATRLRHDIVHHRDGAATTRVLRAWRTRPLMHRAAIAGLAGAAVLAVAGGIGLNMVGGDGARTAWSAPLVRMAQHSPRLLLDAPGWRVSRADEFATQYGEVEFVNGAHRMQVNWYEAAIRPIEQPGPNTGTTLVTHLRRGGSVVTVARFTGANRFLAAWRADGRTIEVDGTADDARAFLAALAAFRTVDVDTWLAAMPASVVTPGARSAAVDRMLEDVPLPPGFDVQPLRTGGLLEQYQLGAKVTGAVACAWIARWVDARRTGDTAAAEQAVAAMRGSHNWRVLRDMSAVGDYPRSLWDLVAAMDGTTAVPAGKPGVTLASAYRESLGCDAP